MTHTMTTKDQLPPLPEPDVLAEDGRDKHGDVAYKPGFTADQMHAYALAALAQQAQEPVAWHTFDGEPDHTLKTDPDAFDAVAAGIKTYEIRKDDRGYKVGDKLLLKRTRYTGNQMFMRPAHCPLEYTGEEARRVVSHIQRGYGLGDDWVILSFATTPQPQPAPQVGEVTDEQIDDVISAAINFYTTRKSRPEARAEIRAILALRPHAVPMTPEQIKAISQAAFHVVRSMPDDEVNGDTWDIVFARAVEAHHGITTQGVEGEQA